MGDSIAPEQLANPRSSRTRVAVAIVAGLLVVVAPIAFVVLDRGGSGSGSGAVVDANPRATVRAAVGQTVAAGSYEMDTETTSVRPEIPAPPGCRLSPGTIELQPNGSRVVSDGGPCPPFPPQSYSFTTHTIVNFEPYAMVARTTTGSFAGVTTHVNETHVWQLGAATVGYGPGNPGMLLTDYARQVIGTLGPGPGALAMLGLASQGGQLDLEEAAVARAEPAGSGVAGGVEVTYYDATIDVRALADSPRLSDVERDAINAALPLLEQSGYRGTTQRIGISDDGFVREVFTKTRFDDGSSSERHSVLSNIGCAPKVAMPNEPPAPEVPDEPCPPPSTTSTTAATTTSTSSPLPTTSITTVPSTSVTTVPSPSATTVPGTTPSSLPPTSPTTRP